MCQVLRRDLAPYSCAGNSCARARAARTSCVRARVARNCGARARVASPCAIPIGGSSDAWKKAIQFYMSSVWPQYTGVPDITRVCGDTHC